MGRAKRFTVLWAEPAVADLVDIIEHIRRGGSASIAKRILRELKAKGDRLSSFPERGRVVPEILNEFGVNHYREVIYKRWRMIYRIEKKTVFVLRVVDSSRNVEDLILLSGLRRPPSSK